MQERFKEYEKFVDGHLKRFIESVQDEVKAFALLFSGVSKDEVYRQISAYKGAGKSHVPGKKEGKLKRP